MAHKFSVETVTWFPHDTGMFITSGMDHTIKIWDTNTWTVSSLFVTGCAAFVIDYLVL